MGWERETYKDAVVELNSGRVFKDVPPPDIRSIRIPGIGSGEKFVQGGYDATSH